MEVNHKGSAFLFIINFDLVMHRLVRPCSNLLNLSHIVNSFSKFIHSRIFFFFFFVTSYKSNQINTFYNGLDHMILLKLFW